MLNPSRKEKARAIGGWALRILILAVVAAATALITALVIGHYTGDRPDELAQAYGRLDRIHARAVGTAPIWMLKDLVPFTHWTIPILFFTYGILTIVQHIQRQNRLQTSMRNLFGGEFLFWGVVWLSFSLRMSLIWTIGEFAAYATLVTTALVMIYRLTKRYGFNRKEDGEPA